MSHCVSPVSHCVAYGQNVYLEGRESENNIGYMGKWVDGCICVWVCVWMSGHIDSRGSGGTDRHTHIHVCICMRVDEWINQQIDGGMGGWING